MMVKKTIKKKKQVKNEVPKNTKPKVMNNHIEEYFAKVEGSKEAFHSRELFRANPEDVDIKTDLGIQEIVLVNKLLFNDELLKKKGLNPVYKSFIHRYMRLKISLDRKSRQEFVKINTADKTEEATSLLSNLSNITGVRK